MAKLKHPATLIQNGRVIARGVSFAAALKLAGAADIKGAARRRVNFYKGKSFYFENEHGAFGIVPMCDITYHLRYVTTISAFDPRADLNDPSSWGVQIRHFDMTAQELIDELIDAADKYDDCHREYKLSQLTELTAHVLAGEKDKAYTTVRAGRMHATGVHMRSWLDMVVGMAA